MLKRRKRVCDCAGDLQNLWVRFKFCLESLMRRYTRPGREELTGIELLQELGPRTIHYVAE